MVVPPLFLLNIIDKKFITIQGVLLTKYTIILVFLYHNLKCRHRFLRDLFQFMKIDSFISLVLPLSITVHCTHEFRTLEASNNIAAKSSDNYVGLMGSRYSSTSFQFGNCIHPYVHGIWKKRVYTMLPSFTGLWNYLLKWEILMLTLSYYKFPFSLFPPS